jgi:hypothetical protein
MNKHSIEFTVITFLYDLPQFYLLCLSIKKYHNRDYKIRVIYNYDDSTQLDQSVMFKTLIEQYLSEFNLEFSIKPLNFGGAGWHAQQLLKWHSAYTSDAEWQVVLDTKNFYIKSFDSLDSMEFVQVPGFAFPREDAWIQQELDKSHNFLASYQPTYPQKFSAMTPWIWNTKKVKDMLDTVWPNLAWQSLEQLPGTEWFLYLAWIGNDIQYHPKQIVSGLWGDGVVDADRSQQLENSDVCFWTHHRFVGTDTAMETTKKVIRAADIASEDQIQVWLDLRSKWNHPC